MLLIFKWQRERDWDRFAMLGVIFRQEEKKIDVDRPLYFMTSLCSAAVDVIVSLKRQTWGFVLY